MADAEIIQIADAVVAELNLAVLSQPLQAERVLNPAEQLEDMDTLHVSVTPRSRTISVGSRGEDLNQFTLEVGVRKRFSGAPELEDLMLLAQEVADFLTRRDPAGHPDAGWVQTVHEPLVVQDHLDQLSQFTSVVAVTYEVLKETP